MPVTPAGQDFLAVKQNGSNDTIYLLYADNAVPNGTDCTTSAGQASTISVTWRLTISTDSGSTWTTYTMDSDTALPNCLTNQQNGHNRVRSPIAYDAVTGKVIFGIEKRVSDAGGTAVGTRVITYVYPNHSGGNSPDSYIPLCNASLCPRSGVPCLVNGAPPVGETWCQQFGSEVATSRLADSTSRAAIAWHDMRDTVSPAPPTVPATSVLNWQSDIWGASIDPSIAPPPVTYTMSRLTPLSTGIVPWKQTGTNGNTWWGDYESMTSVPGGTYYAFWADDRNQTTSSEIYDVSFGP